MELGSSGLLRRLGQVRGGESRGIESEPRQDEELGGEEGGERRVGANAASGMMLAALLRERKRDLPERSYSAELFRKGRGAIAQKVGEEALELGLAAVSESPERALSELTDLVYAIAPNGRTLTYAVTPPGAGVNPVGVFKASFANGIFAAAQFATGPGQPTGEPFVPGRPMGYLAPAGSFDPALHVAGLFRPFKYARASRAWALDQLREPSRAFSQIGDGLRQ